MVRFENVVSQSTVAQIAQEVDRKFYQATQVTVQLTRSQSKDTRLVMPFLLLMFGSAHRPTGRILRIAPARTTRAVLASPPPGAGPARSLALGNP